MCVNALVISIALLFAEGEKRAATLRLVAGLCMLVTVAAPLVEGRLEGVGLEFSQAVELTDFAAGAYSDAIKGELTLFLTDLGVEEPEFELELETLDGSVRIVGLTLFLYAGDDTERIRAQVETFVGIKPEVSVVG